MATDSVKTVLAISRQLGSGGSFIGQTVAKRFNLRYADRDILHEAALALGVEAAAVESLAERVEGFWGRIAHMFVRGGAEGLHAPLDLPVFEAADLFAIQSQIIREIASRESAVIVGRGGAQVLRDRPGLISIFVHAPVQARVRRVMDTRQLSVDEATALVRRSDRERAAFVESLSGCPWTTASLYDLTLNTATIGLEASAEIVAGIVGSRLGSAATER